MFEFKVKYNESHKKLWIMHATQPDIDSMMFPKDVEDIVVCGDYIQSFRIPEGVHHTVWIARGACPR